MIEKGLTRPQMRAATAGCTLTYVFLLHYTDAVSASVFFSPVRGIDDMKNFGQKGGAMRSFSGASLAVAGAVLVLFTAGCSQVGILAAMKNYKAANAAYQQQDYKK